MRSWAREAQAKARSTCAILSGSTMRHVGSGGSNPLAPTKLVSGIELRGLELR